jgi:hypothetical protein
VIPQASSILVTLVTFGVYSQVESEPLTSAKIFTGLALFNQMLVPLFILPITVNVVVKGVVSTRRLAEFLSTPSLERGDGEDCFYKRLFRHGTSTEGAAAGVERRRKSSGKARANEDAFSEWSLLDPLAAEGGHGQDENRPRTEKKLR